MYWGNPVALSSALGYDVQGERGKHFDGVAVLELPLLRCCGYVCAGVVCRSGWGIYFLFVRGL